MQTSRLATLRRSVENRGFALIVTVSLMVLLTLIAVGMLTLSSISLRASSNSAAMEEARQNARLSMQLALAQLQSLTGLDTRVTAPRLPGNPQDAVDSVVPVTGAWRSWEGSDHEANGKPKAPDYASKKQAGDPAAAPAGAGASGSGRFLGWLTSTAAFTSPDASKVPDVQAAAATGYVPLVAAGSMTDTKRRVYMKPTYLDGKKGSIAWWTSGDNSKALINTDRVEKPSSVVTWQERLRGNGRPDGKSFGLEKVDELETDTVIPTTASLKLVSPTAELKKIHDLTGYNRGLLTNTATGGWRRDLSLFSERYSSLPSTNLPLFTLEPGKVQTYSKAQSGAVQKNALIYPWASYRNNGSGSAWMQVPPISSWTAMVDYMLQYKTLSTSSATRTAMPVTTTSSPKGGVGGDRFKFVDQVRRFPQIARMQWIYSLTSYKDPNRSTDPKPYKAGLLITPVLTMWNPYNVELAFNAFEIRIQQTSPLRFQFKVGTQTLQPSSLSEITKTDTNEKGEFLYEGFTLKVPSGTIKPGESRIYGINDPTPRLDTRSATQKGGLTVDLTEGYRPNGGYMFFGINKGQFVYAAASESFGIERVTYDGVTLEGGRDGKQKSGIGFLFDMVADSEGFAHRMVFNVNELGGDAIASALYPPLTKILDAKQIGTIEKEKNQPFASAIFSYRMASPMSDDLDRHKHLFTRGMLQTNPLCSYTEIGYGDDDQAVTSMDGTGVYHPANAPYDFAFQDVEGGWNATRVLPQSEKGTNRSYIVSGLTLGDGLTRCVMAELPTRPLQSLAELQHFDARYNNPITPFQFNLIGNGSAHPVFGPDQVAVQTSFNDGMCNDDAYILNHLLFDDWFVSSIAPDLRDFRSSSERSITNVYKDHLELTTPLPNRLYLPSADAAVVDGKVDVSKAVSNSNSTSKNPVTGMYSFESIASKLEVAGMFNINSVSLDAWKALLRQSRDAEVPYLSANGRTQTDTAVSYSYPRTSIAGDRSTDSGSGESNGGFPAAAEFAGHRVLTDEQIDALAEEIVNEIKKRGPFLSLAEFVNRQLSSDKELAIAGTIQKALDNLAEMGASPKNPFQELQKNSVHITSLPPDNGTLDYKFEEAAYGWSAFGVPGWVRQADILRPLAPVISARDDTFTIRAYGDSRDRANPDKIVARAWCEVVVRRQAAYVDPTDPAEIAPRSDKMKSEANKRFGRRYEIVTFRWLDEGEV